MLFPGAGLLVLSAWCLGVLNSHHRFLLSYTAPVLWNAAMIATLRRLRPPARRCRGLAVLLAWGSVAGSALQFAVQLPAVLRVAPDLRFALDIGVGARADGRPQLRPGVHQPRRRADQRLHRHDARELAADGRRRRRCSNAQTAVHAAGQPVRHVGVGRRAAGDVGRRGDDRRQRGAAARGSTPACARSRSSSCRRRWRFSRSAT